MRQVFLAALLLLAGLLLLGFLWLGAAPPKPQVRTVDHVIPLTAQPTHP